MDVSVILTTYNQPDWLEKVIWGYAAQLHRSFEIVIADDGSTPDSAVLISQLRRDTGLNIQHVWHEDQGFRKCRILNRAILSAANDYLVFSDADCIPRQDFLTAHVSHAARGRFLSGGLVRLPLELSKQIKIDNILSQRATEFSWLRKHGLSLSQKCLKLTRSPWRGKLFDRLTTTQATWNGHNASGWKDDLLRVNGFDERMGYGGEDRELGSRLVHMGIRPYQIRHQAVCVHLHHGRSYVEKNVLRWNKQHRKTVLRQRLTWTDYGLTELQGDSPECVILRFPSGLREEHGQPAHETTDAVLQHPAIEVANHDHEESRKAA